MFWPKFSETADQGGGHILTVFTMCRFAPTYPSFNRMPKDIDKKHTLFNPGGLLDLHHFPDRKAVVMNLLSAVELKEDGCKGACADR